MRTSRHFLTIFLRLIPRVRSCRIKRMYIFKLLIHGVKFLFRKAIVVDKSFTEVYEDTHFPTHLLKLYIIDILFPVRESDNDISCL